MRDSQKVSGSTNRDIMAERLRIAAIVESPEGIARPKAAMQLALRSSMEAESAIELLRSIPADNPYLAAMEREGPVGIGASSPGGNGSVVGDAKAARLAELKGGMQAFNISKGYIEPDAR